MWRYVLGVWAAAVLLAVVIYGTFAGVDAACASNGWLHRYACDLRPSEILVAVFALLLTLFCGLVFGAIHQFRVTARDVAAAQRRQVEAVERAIINAIPDGVDPFDATAYAEGRVRIRNVGRLPARKVHWFIDVALSSDGKRNHFPLGALTGDNVVHAGSEMMQWGRTAVSPQQFQNFVEGNLWIYVWGAILYDDGFGNERRTNFCHRYDSSGFRSRDADMTPQQASQLGRGAVSSLGANYHLHGNDGD